ncbi:MAG: purine-binding chemotaxis protein CheW, partial [Chloroflexi bacterium]|nr:purine-binding chemotaxis protein CheW [Chloroflexota bacterium]
MTQKEAAPNQKRAAGIDWSEVHRRLETAQAALEQRAAPTLAERKKILKARAKALAREPERKEAAGETIEVIEFLLAHERYGLESRFVREVYPLKELTPLPCTPPFVLGLVNVRGQILSVIDLKKFFDLPEKGLTDLNKLIILDSGGLALSASASLSVNSAEGMAFGILADAVLGVRPIPASELQPSLPTLTGIREEFLKGVTRERVVILDAERLLSSKDIIVHEEVEA